MPTINFFVSAKKRKLAPVYVRLSAGRGVDIILKSGLLTDPHNWSNRTQAIKQRIKTEEDNKFELKLRGLRAHIENEVRLNLKGYTKEWLASVIYHFHHNRSEEAKTLNEYIEKFLIDAESGKIKNKSGRNIADGTIRGLRGFQTVFNEYQGVYTDKRKEKLEEAKKALRTRKILDFEDINIDFYNLFKNYLSDEGYSLNTQGRYIKQLKYFLAKSLSDKKHNNREFKENAFRGISEDAFSIYLTKEEVEKIYQYDLRNDKRMEVARDKFIVLCETALRVSDYDKIDMNIHMSSGRPLIYLYQTKAVDPVVIPLSQRMEEILNKYEGRLPRIPEQYVNKYIKTVALWCGITEIMNWESTKYGKRYSRSAPRWKLISSHTGRRTAASNMYRDGIKPLYIMRITGHKSERSFLRYIRMDNEEVALELSQHPYFTGSTMSVSR